MFSSPIKAFRYFFHVVLLICIVYKCLPNASVSHYPIDIVGAGQEGVIKAGSGLLHWNRVTLHD